MLQKFISEHNMFIKGYKNLFQPGSLMPLCLSALRRNSYTRARVSFPNGINDIGRSLLLGFVMEPSCSLVPFSICACGEDFVWLDSVRQTKARCNLRNSGQKKIETHARRKGMRALPPILFLPETHVFLNGVNDFFNVGSELQGQKKKNRNNQEQKKSTEIIGKAMQIMVTHINMFRKHHCEQSAQKISRMTITA